MYIAKNIQLDTVALWLERCTGIAGSHAGAISTEGPIVIV
jgi:hypothetical protein